MVGEDGIINIFHKAQADVDSWTLMGATPLIEASTKHVKVVEKSLRAGADVNAEMLDGRRALWMAINGGIVEIVEMLSAAGANVSEEHGSCKKRWKQNAMKSLKYCWSLERSFPPSCNVTHPCYMLHGEMGMLKSSRRCWKPEQTLMLRDR